jgi:hypothetical protein
MPGGFNQGKTTQRQIVHGSIDEAIHESVDQMLEVMRESGATGGVTGEFDFPCPLEAPTHSHKIRVLVQDITDEKLCPFCDGTGVDGS